MSPIEAAPQATHDAPENGAAFEAPALVINAAAGSTEDIREAARAIFAARGMRLRAEYVEPDAIAAVVAEVMEKGCDLFVSFGGDGTSRHSGKTAIAHGVPFIPLPGGTMNMLPKLLYRTDSWREALESALESRTRWLACGSMNGEPFFCGGFIGAPTRLNRVRERLRDGDILDAMGALRDAVKEIDLDDTLRFGPLDAPEAGEGVLVNLQCPGMAAHAPVGTGLEMTGLGPDSALEVARLGINALLSDFRRDACAKSFVVEAGRITGPGGPEVLLDGEPVEMRYPLEVRLHRKGVRVLAPPLKAGTVRA